MEYRLCIGNSCVSISRLSSHDYNDSIGVFMIENRHPRLMGDFPIQTLETWEHLLGETHLSESLSMENITRFKRERITVAIKNEFGETFLLGDALFDSENTTHMTIERVVFPKWVRYLGNHEITQTPIPKQSIWMHENTPQIETKGINPKPNSNSHGQFLLYRELYSNFIPGIQKLRPVPTKGLNTASTVQPDPSCIRIPHSLFKYRNILMREPHNIPTKVEDLISILGDENIPHLVFWMHHIIVDDSTNLITFLLENHMYVESESLFETLRTHLESIHTTLLSLK